MLRSSNCVLTGKTSMEYSKLNECPLDPGKQHLAEHLCMGGGGHSSPGGPPAVCEDLFQPSTDSSNQLVTIFNLDHVSLTRCVRAGIDQKHAHGVLVGPELPIPRMIAVVPSIRMQRCEFVSLSLHP